MFDDPNDQNQQDSQQAGQIVAPQQADTNPVTSSSDPIDTDSPPAVQGSTVADLDIPELPATTSDDNDGLLAIRKQALGDLSPLVDKLDQSPEEKFKTTMMMIQASDDQSLVKAAYEAAKGIEDEKERAQALLDVINEINYFTQHNSDN